MRVIQQKRIMRGILEPYSLYFTQILNIKSIENILNLSPTFLLADSTSTQFKPPFID